MTSITTVYVKAHPRLALLELGDTVPMVLDRCQVAAENKIIIHPFENKEPALMIYQSPSESSFLVFKSSAWLLLKQQAKVVAPPS